MSDPSALLDRLASKADRLYSLPTVAMQVLDLAGNPQFDTRALKECIENDPALTTKILRVVNSSLFGLSREVSDLNQALTLLGTKPLKLLVLGFSLPEGLFHGVAADVLGRYWRHTLTKAIAAREIAETFWKQPGDDAFVAGLLQDIAVLVLIQQVGEPYLRFLARLDTRHDDLVALETETMGFDHTALTARLMARWGLPASLAKGLAWEDVRRALEDPPGEAPTQSQILHLAELVTRVLEGGSPEVLQELLEAGRRYHDISTAQIEALVAVLQEKVDQLAEVLLVDLPDTIDYREVLAQAHEQLARVADDVAGDLVNRTPSRAAELPQQRLAEEMQLLSEAVRRASAATIAPKALPVAPPARAAATALQEPSPTGGRTTKESADPGLIGQLSAVAAACRQARCSLSLMLVELIGIDDLLMALGVEGLDRVRGQLEKACRGVDHPCPLCMSCREYGFAVVLADCDRRAATQLAHQLVDDVARAGLSPHGARRPVIGVGVAAVSVPPKNFPAEDLLEAAERCLYGSQVSGGGVVKSIEIY